MSFVIGFFAIIGVVIAIALTSSGAIGGFLAFLIVLGSIISGIVLLVLLGYLLNAIELRKKGEKFGLGFVGFLKSFFPVVLPVIAIVVLSILEGEDLMGLTRSVLILSIGISIYKNK